MSRFLKEEAYNDGYAHGYLSDEELADMGYTREPFVEHIEEAYTHEIYNPHILSDQTECIHGLLDGARDLRKKQRGRSKVQCEEKLLGLVHRGAGKIPMFNLGGSSNTSTNNQSDVANLMAQRDAESEAMLQALNGFSQTASQHLTSSSTNGITGLISLVISLVSSLVKMKQSASFQKQ